MSNRVGGRLSWPPRYIGHVLAAKSAKICCRLIIVSGVHWETVASCRVSSYGACPNTAAFVLKSLLPRAALLLAGRRTKFPIRLALAHHTKEATCILRKNYAKRRQ